jgi:hypothetical protein
VRTARSTGRIGRLIGLGSLIVVAAACTSASPVAKAGAGAKLIPRAVVGVSAVGGQSLKDVAGQPIAFGTARYFGGVRPSAMGSGVVGIAASPDGHGYWLATASGRVLHFGTAGSFRSNSGRDSRAVAIVASGEGYWLAYSSGAVTAFGDASHYGSATDSVSTPIAAMASMPNGRGYWLAASGGRVLRFGDARLYGSGTPLLSADHVVAMAGTHDGKGYWLAASDGQVFSFGDAQSYGSAVGELAGARLVAMVATTDARGYWLAASDGAVFRFGDARLFGSAAPVVKKDPVVAMAAVPGGAGYWLLPTRPATSVGLPAPGAGFVPGHVTSIGDSVMIDAEPDLQADIPGIDVEAAVSRQWYEGVSLAQQLKAEGRLGAIVVVDLGTNGPVTPDMFAQMMSVLAGASRVVFVTVHLPASYSWSQSVNATLRQCVPQYPRARLADFNSLADKHPEWFYGDGIHMPIGGAGAQAMALLIKSQI